jgi:hypothetical protein
MTDKLTLLVPLAALHAADLSKVRQRKKQP